MVLELAPVAPRTEGARTFLHGDKKHLIGGSWVAGTGDPIPARDPATQEVLATLARGTAADADAAVAAARASFEDRRWRGLLPARRAAVLWALADLIDAHADALAEIETLDQGKTWATSRLAEIPAAAAQFRYFAGFATKIGGQTITPSIGHAPPGSHVIAHTLREPVGVVAAITPWNSPLLMAAMKLAPALAAGCSVVLKPAEDTSLTALYLGTLLEAAGLPPGVVNIVTGFGHEVGARLAEHPHVDKIAFTGSTATGRRLVVAAAGNLKRLTLELGGKSPLIVLADADLDAAIEGVIRGSFANGGQVCVSGSRLYVARPVADAFAERLVARVKALRLGHGLDPQSQMGALISPAHAAKVAAHATGAHGGTLLTGGMVDGPHGSFVHPAVVAEPDPGSALMREEIFGPVAALVPFDDADEVTGWANDTPYGLAASVWTRSLSAAHRMAGAIRAGTVWINGHSYFSPELPKGGWKASGWGVENNAEGLDNYLQTKTVCMIV